MANGVQIITGFDVNTGKPIDFRLVKNTLVDRDGISQYSRYWGMVVLVLADYSFYQLRATTNNIADNANWQKLENSIRYEVEFENQTEITITHNLSYPNVGVWIGNKEVITKVIHNFSAKQFTVSFLAAKSGKIIYS